MKPRVTAWILGDQLLDKHPALLQAEAECSREEISVVLIESDQRIAKRPYQKKKIVLLLSAMRHYARSLSERGIRAHVIKAADFRDGLRQYITKYEPQKLITMAANDYPGRRFQEEQLARVLGFPIDIVPNRQFLTSLHDPYRGMGKQKRVVMEHFYRKMRTHFDVLMEDESPRGGQWNFDKHNRKTLPKGLRPPSVLQFQPDPITQEVIQEVEDQKRGVGSIDGFDLAVTRDQALEALEDFIDYRLHDFGAYEDAMSSEHSHLYHSKLSAYLNIGLLEPMEVIRTVEAAYASGSAPINSVEGFIRQIIGWREYIYWNYWRLMPELLENNYWDAKRPLPAFFWSGSTQMNCLQRVINRAISTGYNHHIERLMVLCNFCLLAGINPQEVNEWFLSLYIDAYDWVMAPNVLGMGLNADGGKIATKPYIASSNYINKMSDFCSGCYFDQRKRHGDGACPFNYLYWYFLIMHEDLLRANPRMGRSVLSLRHLDHNERIAVRQEAERFIDSICSAV